MNKKGPIIGVIIVGVILLLLLPTYSSPTTSSQMELALFIWSVGAMIVLLMIFASSIARGIKILVAPIEKRLAKRPFARFFTKKILFLLVTVFLAYTLLFVIPRLAPTNPAEVAVRKITVQPGMTPEKVEAMREKYYDLFGLNKPIAEQYYSFWKRVLTMDFGLSISRYPKSVANLIMDSLGWTLVLVIPVWILAFIVGNYLGAWAAFSKNKLIHAYYTFSVYLNSAPYYWFALILVFVFAVKLGWFPTARAYTPGLTPSLSLRFISDAAYHYALPFLSLFISGIGNWCTGMRAMTIYERQSDYVYYARQMGFGEGKLRKYAQRNAILPQVTGLPIILSSLIGQTMLVEIVFGWPGLGTLALGAARNLDYPLLEGLFVITVVVVLIGNFLMDIIYGFIDPRIRTGYVGG